MTNIEWTDQTWNPVRGCRKVSPGCKNCYAETMAKRLRAMGQPGYLNVVDEHGRWTGTFETDPARLAEPLGWKKPRRVFVNSMSDLFGEGVPFEFIAAVFGVMAATPRHTYQVLTKRSARMVEFFQWVSSRRTRGIADDPIAHPFAVLCGAAADFSLPITSSGLYEQRGGGPAPWPLPNVWLGVSVENQAAADERIPLLLQAAAAVRFLSCEPLLGQVDLTPWLFWDFCQTCEQPGNTQCVCRGVGPVAAGVNPIDWVIAGGESGQGARVCEVAWLRSIVEQCDRAQVACFVKQLGARPLGVPPCIGCEGERFEGDRCERCGDVAEVEAGRRVLHLKDRKGGDPSEWPTDLQVRQWPRVGTDADGSTAPIEHRRFPAAGGGL